MPAGLHLIGCWRRGLPSSSKTDNSLEHQYRPVDCSNSPEVQTSYILRASSLQTSRVWSGLNLLDLQKLLAGRLSMERWDPTQVWKQHGKYVCTEGQLKCDGLSCWTLGKTPNTKDFWLQCLLSIVWGFLSVCADERLEVSGS